METAETALIARNNRFFTFVYAYAQIWVSTPAVKLMLLAESAPLNLSILTLKPTSIYGM
jgi:hypothetical protein